MSDKLPQPLIVLTDDLHTAVQALIVMNLQIGTAFYNVLGALETPDPEKRKEFIRTTESVLRILGDSTVALGNLFFKSDDDLES